MRSGVPIDVIEAAYRLDGDELSWLRGVTEAIQPLLDDGFGVHGSAFDLSAPTPAWDSGSVTIGGDPNLLRQALLASAHEPEPATEVLSAPPPLSSLSQAMRESGISAADVPVWTAFCEANGLADNFALRVTEPGGRGLLLAGFQRAERTVDRRTQRVWARVAAHIAAGRRIRTALSKSESDPGVEAVLTPSGKLEHAEGVAATSRARATLRAAVRRCEEARTRKGRSDPDRATAIWTALVAGRWSLVDQFERGGRRFLIARPNLHDLSDPRALSERERVVAHLVALGKSNKLIAYELGLAESTIATHLKAAIRKLGASSRVDLVRLLAGHA